MIARTIRRNPFPALLPLLLLILGIPAGCSMGPNSPLRQNRITRALVYPEPYPPGRGLDGDTPGRSFDHADFAAVLEAAVREDHTIAYGTLARDTESLDRYIDRLARAPLEDLSRHEQLALLLNAYNAFTLKLMARHPQVSSIRDIPASKRWTWRGWTLAGQTVSLHDLEHEWIRRAFREPRVHFALVCASTGCPPLRKEPYDGTDLDHQLEEQARAFLAREENCAWDAGSRTLRVSELLDWFAGDFGAHRMDLIGFVAEHAPVNVGAGIRGNGTVTLAFLVYDWTLNGDWE